MRTHTVIVSPPEYFRQRWQLFCVAALIGSALVSPAKGQLRSEMRDPVRGVSFHSIEWSDQSINDLQVLEGTFTDSDRLAVGLSAMVFDGETRIDPYILWIRHQGRDWLDYELAQSVQVMVDDHPLGLEKLRSPQRFMGAGDLAYEKLEFLASAEQVIRLLGATAAVISIRSSNGTVEKVISDQELARIRKFIESIESSVTDG